MMILDIILKNFVLFSLFFVTALDILVNMLYNVWESQSAE